MTKSYEFNWQKHLPEFMQEGASFDRFDEGKSVIKSTAMSNWAGVLLEKSRPHAACAAHRLQAACGSMGMTPSLIPRPNGFAAAVIVSVIDAPRGSGERDAPGRTSKGT
ncbi:1-phosphatidylinositol 4,5-bisphosphate phosphodiesterase beta-4 [Liparis tanakae]|uniref:1-phosphatidylinositol 4,5-bisphosphate phosphodiesterase beta-4 n=1 Tax=Liparis tanakae TaxID=230148 RepID=A0A4Z2FCD3_9TELE|nr:1-phosphatidylinositol 4,5-bisphosphate phosphodiesterase beta-4 [Liparis tanakae]